MNKTLIIIPVYNEEGNIKPLIKNIFKYLKRDKSIFFVDDNSKDKTRLEIQECQKKYKKIFLKVRKFKLGIGSAHKFALKWAYKKKSPRRFWILSEFLKILKYGKNCLFGCLIEPSLN